jgi:head-tail adaptor
MRPGKLQARIQIERECELVSDSGLVRKAWLPIVTTRAEVKQASTEEFLLQQIIGDKARAAFLIRWPSQPISTSDRITYRGMIWNIVRLQEIGRKRGLEIRAEAVA